MGREKAHIGAEVRGQETEDRGWGAESDFVTEATERGHRGRTEDGRRTTDFCHRGHGARAQRTEETNRFEPKRRRVGRKGRRRRKIGGRWAPLLFRSPQPGLEGPCHLARERRPANRPPRSATAPGWCTPAAIPGISGLPLSGRHWACVQRSIRTQRTPVTRFRRRSPFASAPDGVRVPSAKRDGARERTRTATPYGTGF